MYLLGYNYRIAWEHGEAWKPVAYGATLRSGGLDPRWGQGCVQSYGNIQIKHVHHVSVKRGEMDPYVYLPLLGSSV